ncbi:STAS domain-containing protein [Candidatus Magnetominusculus xianensis]|uniref:Anti-sigma factor antagonist n=1 Tax=Candidatus Magnetominusculus xianensis TaxID=1748249 RepID=A0ABR5SBC9_9BACT|nr:STAS domain-containing protein [Candidatus Magnetominusculus xianensis]KWT76848.1 anti-anti-sigma factor [Candidatus Magnetominusculus xianensis]MBF0402646.1 STAS domain-containing protein [Nitrospirota bacterium]
MNISIRQQSGEIAVVIVSGRIDTVAAPLVEKEIKNVITGGKHKIVIDLSGSDYISSGGLRVLLGTAKDLKAVGGELRLCGLTDNVMKIFKLAGFTKVFNIYETETDAIKSFS